MLYYSATHMQCNVFQSMFPDYDSELHPLPCYMRQACTKSWAMLPKYSHLKPPLPNPISKPTGLFQCRHLWMPLPSWYQQCEWCAMWNWKQSEIVQLKWDFSNMWNNGKCMAGFSLLRGFLRMGVALAVCPNINFYLVESSAPAGIQSKNNWPVKGLNPGSWTSRCPC